MGLKEWVIPQDKKFFDLLDAIAANNVEAAEALKELLDRYDDLPRRRRRIKDFEHKGDDLVHDMYGMLNRSFITPIDHADFTMLVTGLDDFLDYIDATVNKLVVYDIEESTEGMRSLAALIVKQSNELQKAVTGLRQLRKPEEIQRAVIEVHSLENAADSVLNEALAELFRGDDAIFILKHKEIYEYLETATDKGEDAANIIGDIIVKNA